MKTRVLKENLTKLSPEEIDRAAGLLVSPLANLFRGYAGWIAKSKSDSVAVTYIYQIATDKKFKSVAKRQQFLSLLNDRIVFHLSNLFDSENINDVKFATDHAIKFTKIAGPQDVAAYIDVISKNLSRIENALYSIIHTIMGDKTIGASRVYNEVIDILKDMRILGFSDIEMNVRSKYKSEKILMTPPGKTSTWGYYELYDVLDTMTSGRDTVVNRFEYLSSEAQDKILGLKDYFLYREGNIADGRMTEFVKFIIDERYPKMKRFGLPWPELDFKYSSALEMLEFYKNPIIKMLLKSMRGGNRIDINKTISDLKKSGVAWPELERIEAVASKKSITESKDVNSMSENDQIEYVRKKCDNIKNIQNPSERVQLAAIKQNGRTIEFIQNPSPELFANPEVKKDVIKSILVDLKTNSSIDDIIRYLENHRVDWPELEKIRAAIRKIRIDSP